jgi:alcohol dehydrogenase, propanol-preferring
MHLRAMVLERPRTPLVMRERPVPSPAAGEILVKVAACGVCRTDLHVVDGELPHPRLPIVPGHEIVGRVAAMGEGVAGFAIGERVGIPWLGYTCGVCPYCRTGRENLCDRPLFTGYTRDGGYATHTVADARYCFPLPERGEDAEIAPFLCAGLIGWRSYRMAGAEGEQPQRAEANEAPLTALGLYGFGAAAHILAQVAAGRAAGSTPSLAAAIPRPKRLQDRWARSGPAGPTKCRPSRSTPRSSSPPSGRLFPWR